MTLDAPHGTDYTHSPIAGKGVSAMKAGRHNAYDFAGDVLEAARHNAYGFASEVLEAARHNAWDYLGGILQSMANVL